MSCDTTECNCACPEASESVVEPISSTPKSIIEHIVEQFEPVVPGCMGGCACTKTECECPSHPKEDNGAPLPSTEEPVVSNPLENPDNTLEDPTAEFDFSRKARQEALSQASEVLQRIESGAKFNRKDTAKIMKALTVHALYLDELSVTLLQECYRIVQAIAGGEVSSFNTRANLKAVMLTLIDKGLVTEQDLQKILEEKVLAAEISKANDLTSEATKDIAPE